MTARVVGVLAEALAQHDGQDKNGNVYDDFYDCSCGDWHSDIRSYDERKAAHLEHVASVVAALPNIAIVPLPEPAFQEDGTWEWCSGRSRNAVWINDDGLIEDRFGIGQEPEDVRMWAADLLAAAARAAGGQA